MVIAHDMTALRQPERDRRGPVLECERHAAFCTTHKFPEVKFGLVWDVSIGGGDVGHCWEILEGLSGQSTDARRRQSTNSIKSS